MRLLKVHARTAFENHMSRLREHIYFFGPLLLTQAALCAMAERSTPPR